MIHKQCTNGESVLLIKKYNMSNKARDKDLIRIKAGIKNKDGKRQI